MNCQRILLLLSLLLTGCVTSRTITKNADGRLEMQRLILGTLPSLATRSKAVEFLRKEGFECKYVRDGGFEDSFGMVSHDHGSFLIHGGVIGETRSPRAFRNRNFILARRRDDGPFPTEEIWTLAVTLDSNDVPDDVFVYHGYEK